MLKRNLDGVYFRVEREGKFQSICYSDLTDAEMDEVIKDWPADSLRRMCKVLGQALRNIGDAAELVMVEEDEE